MQLEQTGLPINEIDFTSNTDSVMDSACFEAPEEPCVFTSEENENEKGTQTLRKTVEQSTSTQDFEVVFEGSRNTGTQTEEFEYMFTRPIYQAPDRDYFKSLKLTVILFRGIHRKTYKFIG